MTCCGAHPSARRGARRSDSPPQISDAELVTLAVMQALLGFTSEARWLRFATAHLHHLFPVPSAAVRLQQAAAQSGRHDQLADRDARPRHHTVDDDVWVIDSTPVECARSREATRRSELAGWAEYGYCASHSRYFWGLRLHLLATLHGLPVGFALTGAKADERTVLLDILHTDPTLTAQRPGQTVIGDKNYFGAEFETTLAEAGLTLLRPARKGEPDRSGSRFFKPLRQTIESIFDTYKGQLNLEDHGGKTPTGVLVRVLQHILALTTAIWHNDHTGQPIKRSLLAYDH
jgi:DDE family transposase